MWLTVREASTYDWKSLNRRTLAIWVLWLSQRRVLDSVYLKLRYWVMMDLGVCLYFQASIFPRRRHYLSQERITHRRKELSKARNLEVTGEWRKLHNEKLYALYASTNIIRVIRFRRMRRACSTYGEKRGTYRVLVERSEGRSPLGRPRRRWENNIKINLNEVGWGHELNWSGSL